MTKAKEREPGTRSQLDKGKTSQLIHELRGHLNAIVSSSMLLDRVGSVDPEHQKYLDWIQEKATAATELINAFDSESNSIQQNAASDSQKAR